MIRLRAAFALAVLAGMVLAAGCHEDSTTVSTYATGLTNPRGLAFGPDGNLYVAEAGIGGTLVPDGGEDCPLNFNIYSPYTAGYSGRVTRVLANGSRQVVAEGLPSMTDVYGASYGPTDVAFIGTTLYVLIEMGGCPHALPDELGLPAILRVEANGTTTHVADLGAWHRANPPHFLKDTDPETTDQEPGGVFHSMIADGGFLYVVETNRGFLLRVDPQDGSIDKLYDLSIDNAEHNPIVMTRHENRFYVGTFGEDGGQSELAAFDADFTGYELPFDTLNPLVGLAWHGGSLYGVEIFPYDDQWSTDNANLVRFDPLTGRRTVVAERFASLPNGLVKGPDGALYTSNWGITYTGDGDGQVLRIKP